MRLKVSPKQNIEDGARLICAKLLFQSILIYKCIVSYGTELLVLHFNNSLFYSGAKGNKITLYTVDYEEQKKGKEIGKSNCLKKQKNESERVNAWIEERKGYENGRLIEKF